ncbi:MAG: MFS transporter [Pseudomonadota bacterium]
MLETHSADDAETARQTRRTWRNVGVLVAAQAVLGGQMPLLFVVSALAGQQLAPTPLLATLPISLIVFGSMTTSPWLSALMQSQGRRLGFVIGALGGAAGGALGAVGMLQGEFLYLAVGSYFTGIYMSAHALYRFAAADSAGEAIRARAISYVMAGGLLSAIIGPQLVKLTEGATATPFFASYLAVVALNLVGVFLFAFLDLPKPAPPSAADGPLRSRAEMLRDPRIAVAVICGMVSYALMNLMMTSTPLAVVGCGFGTGDAADVVMAHVLAMFAPSFFTGHLIGRFGALRIIAVGLGCLAMAGGVALAGVELSNFFIALILLGVGWNFGFIGATALLAASHSAAERGRIQGMNDFFVFGLVTVASLSSGGLINSGPEITDGWVAVNIAMAPFLALAAGALIWLWRRERTPAVA